MKKLFIVLLTLSMLMITSISEAGCLKLEQTNWHRVSEYIVIDVIITNDCDHDINFLTLNMIIYNNNKAVGSNSMTYRGVPANSFITEEMIIVSGAKNWNKFKYSFSKVD